MHKQPTLVDFLSGAAIDSAHPVNFAAEAVKVTPPAAVVAWSFLGHTVADWAQLLTAFYAFGLAVQMLGRFCRYVESVLKRHGWIK